MQKTIALPINAFPLTFDSEQVIGYRIWTIAPMPAQVQTVEKIRRYVASQCKAPTRRLREGEGWALAIVETKIRTIPITYKGDGQLVYEITPTVRTHTISTRETSGFGLEILCDILQASLSAQLAKDRRLVSEKGYPPFFFRMEDLPFSTKGPTNSRVIADVSIYRGFMFRIAGFAGVGPCLVLDMRTSYIGKQTLADFQRQNITQPQGIEIEGKFTTWVNDYGWKRQTVYLTDILADQTIGTTLIKDDQTVYAYICGMNPLTPIRPDDRAVRFVYNKRDVYNEAKQYTGAASLLHPKYTYQSEKVQRLHDTPAFPPVERFARIENVLDLFPGWSIDGIAITVNYPLTDRASLLPLPPLRFGRADAPFVVRSPLNQFNSEQRGSWAISKLRSLRRYGPVISKDFRNPFFIYPQGLEGTSAIEAFLQKTQQTCKDYGRAEFDPEISTYRDTATADEIVAKVKGATNYQHAGFVLLALPQGVAADAVYRGVKFGVTTTPTKCFATDTFLRKSMTEHDLTKYSQLNALGMLIENGARLWTLDKPLHYDMHFGFDVAHYKASGIMGATVLNDAFGTDLVFDSRAINRVELISRKIIGQFILDTLNRYAKNRHVAPGRILFQRDGQFFEDELKAISMAVGRFQEQHPELPSVTWAAVNIKKDSFTPVRLFRDENDRIAPPYAGTWLPVNDTTSYLATIGDLSLRHGTPQPLRLELVGQGAGNHPIQDISQDIFWLAQLHWNSPDISTSLPITLHLTDQKLDLFTLDSISDNDEWGDED